MPMTTTNWIDVNERLPELKPEWENGPGASARVLIFNGHYVTIGQYKETYTKRIPRWESWGRCVRVTHWALLPDGPK